MTARPAHVVFLVNLLQDVNIIRPLVHIAAVELRRSTRLLVTTAFRKRDRSGIWERELLELVKHTGVSISDVTDAVEASAALSGQRGLLITASESNLHNHQLAHDILRAVHSGFHKITLQHGFECVGFMQSRDQDLAHGTRVTFAADTVVGWCEASRLTALAPSQRHKLYVAGPPAVLQKPVAAAAADRYEEGLVCENLHSPRLNTAGDFKGDFLQVFTGFCAALAAEGRNVVLRPHPGGQYTLKNRVALPSNARVNNEPIYKVDLSRYAYGISAPSSILIDMVLAGIPTAVWQDSTGRMDLGNYQGLTRISSVDEWVEFSRAATADPAPFLRAQQSFLERQLMPTDPRTVQQRYTALLKAEVSPARQLRAADLCRDRVLYVANSYVATLQLSFVKPLAPRVAAGELVTDMITEAEIKQTFGRSPEQAEVVRWLDARISTFAPTLVVFCRYSGPFAADMASASRRCGAAVIYHIDDDLLQIPEDIGAKKFEYHNHPERLKTVRYLLDSATLVYCSNERLRRHLQSLPIDNHLLTGDIYCSAAVISPAAERPVTKVGYMASADHAHNLAKILPAIVRLLEKHPTLRFELFGSIPVPDELQRFADRIGQAPKIDDYGNFLARFSEYAWDIGICPLVPIHFNLMKSNTKWVEYTAVGAAVVASRSTVYDDCCADGCGMLADTEAEWFEALDRLVSNPRLRFEQVQRAQARLTEQYSTDRLRDQVDRVFRKAHDLRLKAVLEEQTV